MVQETPAQAQDGNETCKPLELPVEVLEILGEFEHGKEYNGWKWVRDYKIGDKQLKLMSRLRQDREFKEFLVHGEIDVCKEKLIELVMHMSRRKHWDDTYVEHELIATDNKGTDIIYSASKYPFPLAKRLYVVARTVYGSMDNTVVIYSKVIPYSYPKRYKWSTQVEDFESALIVRNKEGDEELCEILVTYFENPKVILPATYLNLIIETLVPKILEKMIIACKSHSIPTYQDYCKNLACLPLPDHGDKG
ncbi:hypothetical protein BgAZ_302880 [Babesia gibsoni]|uniref:START domain-containing protein n=1 Tax=Babesia gibsoni TaxID=33632 RepID=A0AAD8P8T0_BABGI|nr:hypothetical protein BgAZ_302880 [Babesia gibsoni]